MNRYLGEKSEVLPVQAAEPLECSSDLIRTSGGLLIYGEYLEALSFRLSKRTSTGARRYESGPYNRVWQVMASLGERSVAHSARSAEMVGMIIVYGSVEEAEKLGGIWVEQSLQPDMADGSMILNSESVMGSANSFTSHYTLSDNPAHAGKADSNLPDTAATPIGSLVFARV